MIHYYVVGYILDYILDCILDYILVHLLGSFQAMQALMLAVALPAAGTRRR
jgi:hypothetical protein